MHDDDGTCTESNRIQWICFVSFVSTQSWPPSALIRVHLIFESSKIEMLNILAGASDMLVFCVWGKQQSLTLVKTRAR